MDGHYMRYRDNSAFKDHNYSIIIYSAVNNNDDLYLTCQAIFSYIIG